MLCLSGQRGATAQERRPFRLTVDPEEGAPRIDAGDLFADERLELALQSGLPLRIQIVAELWKDGFFDSQRGRAEWRASVLYDPLDEKYRVAVGAGATTELTADSLGAVAGVLESAFDLPLRPLERGRYYYTGQVQVETLALSDLEELQRWLRGDLASAVGGGQRVETAVGRGVRRVVVRMLGMPSHRIKVRSEVFEANPLDPG